MQCQKGHMLRNSRNLFLNDNKICGKKMKDTCRFENKQEERRL